MSDMLPSGARVYVILRAELLGSVAYISWLCGPLTPHHQHTPSTEVCFLHSFLTHTCVLLICLGNCVYIAQVYLIDEKIFGTFMLMCIVLLLWIRMVPSCLAFAFTKTNSSSCFIEIVTNYLISNPVMYIMKVFIIQERKENIKKFVIKTRVISQHFK